MKKKDFDNVPERESWDANIGKFDSLVIIPTRRKHDSGYMCMDFVACDKNEPVCRLSGCSDVLHIDGIGGYGKWSGSIPKYVSPKSWSIDCLPCGYLHIWCREKLEAGPALSSFELYGAGDTK